MNSIYRAREAGIRLTRYNSTTNYNVRCKVHGNHIQYAALGAGSNSLELYYCSECDVSNNTIAEGVNGSGILFSDVGDTSIADNFIRHVPGYGIGADSGNVTDVAQVWNNVTICGNRIAWSTGGALYVAPPYAGGVYPGTAYAITNCIISENRAVTCPGVAGGFMSVSRLSGSKIVNNTCMTAGATIDTTGCWVAPTQANNNLS
jgi:hypothetical protein